MPDLENAFTYLITLFLSCGSFYRFGFSW